MDQEQLKRKVDEETTNIFLEFVELEENKGASKTGKRSKTRSRPESVEKAKELLQLKGACRQPLSRAEVVVTERESDGFVVLSTEQAPSSIACSNKHLAGAPTSSVKRPDTLALQPAADPGDPPLFSPCQSYPPSTTGRMPVTSQSLPILTPRITQSCNQQCAATTPVARTNSKQRAKLIAKRLREIGDKIEKEEKMQNVYEKLSGLVHSFAPSHGFSLWCSVIQIFRYLYELMSLLKSQFGEMNPPDSDERWQLFLKTLRLLSHDIVPLISSRGGWGAFLTSSEVCELQMLGPRTDIIGSPLLPRNIGTCTSPRSLPKTHSTPIFPQYEQRTTNSSSFVTTPPCRRSQEFQPSPGSARSLRIVRSHTQPARCETHPRKLWSLSESGSLVDEDGNDDFEESLKSDLEGSTISLENARKIVESSSQLSDSDNEKDDLVFPMQTDDGQTTNPYHHSISSPAVVVMPYQEEIVEAESLYDSGIISSLDTLSLSSTPPQDVSFALESTPLHSTHTDSAVDVSTPPSCKGQKKRPKSGCNFSKSKEMLPFDRARSRSVPMSRRNERPFGGLPSKKQRSCVMVSSSPPCETHYSSGSLSLSRISEAVFYEAVCSLLR